MAERRPPGFNVDLGFYDSQEVKSIPRRIRAAAVGVWTLCGAYSANKLTDGYVDAETLRDFGCGPVIRAALMSTKPEPLWMEGDQEGGITFTRWAKWQRTRAEVKAFQGKDAARKKASRNADKGAPTSDDSEMSARTSGGRSQNVRAESGDPKTKAETKTEIPTHVGGYQDSRSESVAATPGADLVREIIPRSHPPATLTSLRLQASELLNTGTDRDTVAGGLRLWCEKPGVGIGRTILASLCSEVIKTRTAPANGKPHKLRVLAELTNEVRAAEQAQLESADRRAIE